MYAIIVDGKVAEVSAQQPSAGAMFMECGGDVRPGWLVQGGVLVAPPPSPAGDPNADIDRQIRDLERKQHRAVRDYITAKTSAEADAAKTRLSNREAEIASLRKRRIVP